MPIPVPPHFDYASEPITAIEINEDWYSVLQGIFEFSLNPDFWDGDDDDYADIEQAIIGVMRLGSELEGDTMQIKVGSYTGNGSDPQAITGVGFLPVFVIVWMRSDSDDDRGIAFRATGDTNSLTIGSGTLTRFYRDAIGSLDADGFSVNDTGGGDQFNGNRSGRTYTYVAFGE